jgi:hypothetical protein
MGEISAAMTTMALGSLRVPALEAADLRSAFTTSFTPRRRVLDLAAAVGEMLAFFFLFGCAGG